MRSITMCRTTVLAAVASLPALAVAAPAAMPAPAAGDAVIAWVVGDAGFESPRFRRALAIDRLTPADVAARFAALPEGSRVAYSERLLAGLVGDAGDRVVVSGRITDHHGPWLDAASVRTRLEVEQLAKEFASRGTTIDAFLLGGTNPLAAERIDTDDDLVWMAIRNDARFETIASDDLSLAGAMTPTNPQWKLWNEFADVKIAKAIEESVATPLRELNGSLSVAAPIAIGLGRRELDATPIAIRMHGVFNGSAAGGATSAFEVLADELEVAVKASRGGRMLQPWVRPYSHAGTRIERSAIAGTLLWDELVRHAVALGGGRVVYVEDRSLDLAAADASRFAAVLDGVAEELADDSLAYAGEASIRRGQGFVAVGMPIGSGEVLWRISFAPGIGGIDIEIDGGGLRVERRRGESGAWLRTANDSRLEFFDRAFARRDATTGGGLVAAPTTKGSTKVGPLLSAGPEGVALGDSGVGDLNGDGIVDGADLAIHLANDPGAAWGGGITDLNGDGVIDGADMAIHLSGGPESNWNGAGWDDLNGDGIVDGADLAIDLSGGRPGDWNGAGWTDLNGDGINDGADLAITLAGGGSSSAVPGDLNGDGVVDGADLAIDLAGRIRVRKPDPDVAGRPTIVDGGVSTVDDPASGGGSETPNGGTGSSGGAPPTVDPTTPVTPPSAPNAPSDLPSSSLLLPVAMSDSLLETAGPSSSSPRARPRRWCSWRRSGPHDLSERRPACIGGRHDRCGEGHRLRAPSLGRESLGLVHARLRVPAHGASAARANRPAASRLHPDPRRVRERVAGPEGHVPRHQVERLLGARASALVPRGRHRIHVVERARGSRRHGDRAASRGLRSRRCGVRLDLAFDLRPSRHASVSDAAGSRSAGRGLPPAQLGDGRAVQGHDRRVGPTRSTGRADGQPLLRPGREHRGDPQDSPGTDRREAAPAGHRSGSRLDRDLDRSRSLRGTSRPRRRIRPSASKARFGTPSDWPTWAARRPTPG